MRVRYSHQTVDKTQAQSLTVTRRRSWFRRLIWLSLVIAILSYLALVVLAKILTTPAPTLVGAAPNDLPVEDVTIAIPDLPPVHGWVASNDNAQGVVLLLHPVRANRTSMLGRARFLRDAGFIVALIDLQAHGESKGEAITFGWREARGVEATLEMLKQRHPALPIFVIGHSLGGASMVLAARNTEVDGMVLEAVYPTIERAFANRLEMRFGDRGKQVAPLAASLLSPWLPVEPERLDIARAASAITTPVFVISGTDDLRTTPDDTALLYDAFADAKQLWMVEGASHQNLHAYAREEYEERVLTFFAQVAGRNDR